MSSPGRRFNAYIDEAGDDGLKKLGAGSPDWLILGAVLMHAEYDRQRTQAVDRLRAQLHRPPPKPLHWRDLRNDHSKKRRAIALLAREPLVVSYVAIYKPPLARASGFRRKGYLYNYASRLLVERLTWFAGRQGRAVNLLFESRATTSYADLRDYMARIEADRESSIARGSIGDVRPVGSNEKGAQLADFYVSAAREALEPDPWGMTEERYLLDVAHQIYCPPGKSIFAYGFKVFPDTAIENPRYAWMRRLQRGADRERD